MNTAMPWSYDKDENEIHADTIQDSGGDPAHICEMLGPNAEANATHIIKCVSFYDELLKFVGNSKCWCTSELKNDCPACELFARAKSGKNPKMSLQQSINILQPKSVTMVFE